MRSIRMWLAGLLAVTAGIATAQQAPQLAPALKPTQNVAAPGKPGGAAPQPAGPGQLTKSDVDAWLDGFMPYALRNGDIAGAVVVVVRDGQIVTQRGFGYADVAARKPVDPERTLFRPGSVSKLITWTAVMQQVELGKIDLDADINRYLDFKIPPRDGQPVTMRQMMTHTPGFEDRGKDISFFDAKNQTSLGDYLKTHMPRRIFAPGTTPAYSNYGTALAAYVVERVSGVPFNDYIEQRIFTPLGMTRASFRQPLPARLQQTMSTGYPRASAKPLGFEIVGPAPAGAMSATGVDMAKFMIAHLQQGRGILRPETARTMHTSALTLLPPLNRMELGFFETNLNGRQIIGHLGDLQAFHTALHLFMNENTGIYLSVNSSGRAGAAGAIRSALLLDFANRYFPGPPLGTARVDAKTSAEHARMMTGLWQASRRSVSGFMDALGLVGQTEVSVGPKGNLVIADLKNAGGATREWVEIAPFVWREVNGQERLAAKVVDGKVVRWAVDGSAPFTVFDRVPASRSAGWILPLLYAALGVLLLTFLHWPAAALVRRHYQSPLALEGRARWIYRGVRLASALVLAMLAAWMITITGMMGDYALLTAKSDARLWTLQILGLIVFVGAVALAAWNLLLAWRGKRKWTGKLWAVLVLLAALMVLYVAYTFGLLNMTVNY